MNVTHVIACVLLMLAQASGCTYGAVKHLPLWREISVVLGRVLTVAYLIAILWAISATAMMLFSNRSADSLNLVVNVGVFVCFLWAIILVGTFLTTSRMLIAGATYIILATASNTCLMWGIAHEDIPGSITLLIGYIICGTSLVLMIPMLGGGWFDRMIASKAKRGRKSVSSSAKK